MVLAGSLLGEIGQANVESFSIRSLAALAYLIIFGSIVAFTAYTWLLANVPVSTVGTYAYVNPIIAVALGAVILSEPITPRTLHRQRDHHRRRRGDGVRAAARRGGAGAVVRRRAARACPSGGTDRAAASASMKPTGIEPIVECAAREGGWHCSVVLGDASTASRSTAPRSTTWPRAGRRTTSFAPRSRSCWSASRRESIMRSFELPIIGRFFADYPDEIASPAWADRCDVGCGGGGWRSSQPRAASERRWEDDEVPVPACAADGSDRCPRLRASCARVGQRLRRTRGTSEVGKLDIELVARRRADADRRREGLRPRCATGGDARSLDRWRRAWRRSTRPTRSRRSSEA